MGVLFCLEPMAFAYVTMHAIFLPLLAIESHAINCPDAKDMTIPLGKC